MQVVVSLENQLLVDQFYFPESEMVVSWLNYRTKETDKFYSTTTQNNDDKSKKVIGFNRTAANSIAIMLTL